jgi:DNA-binding response OmpR family regulator
MNEHILIVEDDYLIYREIANALTDEGYRISGYLPSYDKAMEYIRIDPPDAAILDIQLKGRKTGLDLAETLNKEYDIPLIINTVLDDSITQKAALQDADMYFVKGGSIRNLLINLKMALSKTTKEQPGVSREKQYLFVMKYYPQLLNKKRRKDSGFITSKNPQIRLSIDEIAYIRYDSRKIQRGYISIVTTEGEVYYKRCSLRNILTTSPYLIQISRTVIVHILNITGHKSYGHVIKTGKHSFVVNAAYLNNFIKEFNKYYE